MNKVKKKQMHLQMESFAASVAHKKKKKTNSNSRQTILSLANFVTFCHCKDQYLL